MAKQLNITEQEELFSTECKLINLKYEYQGYTGTEKWAVVSELSEKELFEMLSAGTHLVCCSRSSRAK